MSQKSDCRCCLPWLIISQGPSRNKTFEALGPRGLKSNTKRPKALIVVSRGRIYTLPKLPTELRLKIWRLAITRRRFITIIPDSALDAGRTQKSHIGATHLPLSPPTSWSWPWPGQITKLAKWCLRQAHTLSPEFLIALSSTFRKARFTSPTRAHSINSI